MPDILHFLRLSAPVERAFDAVSTAEGVRKWWTRDCDIENRVGGLGSFGFYDRKTVTTVTVEALEPPRRVSWRVIDSPAPGGWPGTLIGFDLRPDESDQNGTFLSFSHRGYAEANEGFAIVTTGWAYYLFSLKQHLEHGEGAPHPDVDFGRLFR